MAFRNPGREAAPQHRHPAMPLSLQRGRRPGGQQFPASGSVEDEVAIVRQGVPPRHHGAGRNRSSTWNVPGGIRIWQSDVNDHRVALAEPASHLADVEAFNVLMLSLPIRPVPWHT